MGLLLRGEFTYNSIMPLHGVLHHVVVCHIVVMFNHSIFHVQYNDNIIDTSIDIYIYIYIVYMHVYIYIYIYTY